MIRQPARARSTSCCASSPLLSFSPDKVWELRHRAHPAEAKCGCMTGEALDIDLGQFVNRLYAILIPLSLAHDLEAVPEVAFKSDVRVSKPFTTADMLFRALHLVFTPRVASSATPPWRAAAFAKRLLTAALQWPPATAVRAIELVGVLVEKDPKLEALLSTEDRGGNGLYRPDIDDPQLSNPFGTTFWELHVLAHRHWDARVRDQARKVLHSSS